MGDEGNANFSEDTRFLDCAVCLDKFRDPVMMPCGHTVCCLCFERLQLSAKKQKEELENSGGRKRNYQECLPTCPTCRISIILGEGDLLPKVRVLEECMEYISKIDDKCCVCGKKGGDGRLMSCWECVENEMNDLKLKISFLSEEMRKCYHCKEVHTSVVYGSCSACNVSLEVIMKEEIEKQLSETIIGIGGLKIGTGGTSEETQEHSQEKETKPEGDSANLFEGCKKELKEQDKVCSFCQCGVDAELYHLCAKCLGFQSRNRVFERGDNYEGLGSSKKKSDNPFNVSNMGFRRARKKGVSASSIRNRSCGGKALLARKYEPLDYFLNTGDRFTIHDEDIKSLKGNNPLTDGALSWGLCTVCTECVVGLDKVKIVEPANSHAFRLLSVSDLEEAVCKRKLRKKMLLLMPINDDDSGRADSGRHWSLLVYFSRGKRFVLYDSLRDAKHKIIGRKMAERLDRILNKEEHELKFTVFYDRKVQMNGIDCGVFVIAFVKLILESYHPYENSDCDLDACNQRYVSDLRDTLRDHLRSVGR